MIDWLIHHLMLVWLSGSGVVVAVIWLAGCFR